jgi:predicted DNA-binding ArsR family transcriptional regulator
MASSHPPDLKKMAANDDVKGLIGALAYPKGGSLPSDAARVLGRIGDPRAVEPLIAAAKGVKDRGSSLWVAAVNALGRIGDERAVEALIGMLKDPECAPGSEEQKTVFAALLQSGKLTGKRIDEITASLMAPYRTDMQPILEKYEAMTKSTRPGSSGAKRVKKYHIKMYYEKYQSKSLESLTSILFNSFKSNSEHMACCLALGKTAGGEAKEVLGSVFSRQFHRNDLALISHGHHVCGIAADILKRLGPPAPDSLIEAMDAPGRFRESDQRVVDELLVAVGGADLGQRLDDFLKRYGSSKKNPRTSPAKLRERIQRMKMKLATAGRGTP